MTFTKRIRRTAKPLQQDSAAAQSVCGRGAHASATASPCAVSPGDHATLARSGASASTGDFPASVLSTVPMSSPALALRPRPGERRVSPRWPSARHRASKRRRFCRTWQVISRTAPRRGSDGCFLGLTSCSTPLARTPRRDAVSSAARG